MTSGPHHPAPEPAIDDETRTDPEREAMQLRLLTTRPERPPWRLDERTRRVGRQGIAEAREILRRARPPGPKRLAS